MDGRDVDVEQRWVHERLVGSAAAFHSREVPEPARRTVSVLEVDRPALVIGSTQPEAHVEPVALVEAGVALVRRRSGGGAVLLVPGQALWIDVVVPRDDPLWEDDVGRAAWWLGATWAAALSDLGLPATVHTGGLVASRWSPLVCFAGMGPGEVSVGGRKVVGMAQRRSRAGARFQCVVLRRWDPATLVGLLRLDASLVDAAANELAGSAAGVDRPPHEVAEAVVARLPSERSGGKWGKEG